MPEGVSTVFKPSSSALARSVTPNIFGIEGPVISASMIPTLFPALCAYAASSEVVKDFPTPPLPLTTAITFLIDDFLCGSFKKLSFFCLSEQLLPQDEQS